jgi:hypothetical protein
MSIKVIYADGHYDYLNKEQLSRLLELRQVAKFQRGSDWVIVGEDPVRANELVRCYDGDEIRIPPDYL